MSSNKNLVPDLVNSAYNAVLITAGTIVVSEVSKKITRSRAPQVDFQPRDMAMLALDIGASMGIVQALKNNGIIPDKIMNPQ